MYLDLEESLNNNDNLKKISHCHICCKVFMTPPSYKGVKPKFCHKCYKENIKLKVSNNPINNNNSVNGMSGLNEDLNNNILSNQNYNNDLLHDNKEENNILFLKSNKFKNLNLLFYRILENFNFVISFMFRLINLRFSKDKIIQYMIKQQKIKNKLKQDKIVSESKTKGKKRKERRQLFKKYYQDSVKKYQLEVNNLNESILKQNKYNQIQREILCDEVSNLRIDKDKSTVKFKDTNEKLKLLNNLYLKEKNKNNISCKLSVDDLKKLVNNSNLQNSNIDKNKKEIDNVCNICLTNNKQLAFNCGHLCCCYHCGLHLLENSNENQNCPICRVEISNIFRIY